jgi:hypothetical protein
MKSKINDIKLFLKLAQQLINYEAKFENGA